MPNNINHRKAHSWFQKGENENTEGDCFTSFIYYWIAFNSLYNIYVGREKNRITAFISTEYNNSFDVVLSISEASTFQTPIQDLHLHGHSSASAARDLANTKKSSKNRLIALMKCIYQARCNLFHGEKVPSNYHDQEIANAASKILKEFLTIYFGGQQNGQTTFR